jgi:hypothetical protein
VNGRLSRAAGAGKQSAPSALVWRALPATTLCYPTRPPGHYFVVSSFCGSRSLYGYICLRLGQNGAYSGSFSCSHWESHFLRLRSRVLTVRERCLEGIFPVVQMARQAESCHSFARFTLKHSSCLGPSVRTAPECFL